jgi:hypothetical protein
MYEPDTELRDTEQVPLQTFSVEIEMSKVRTGIA